MQYSYPLIIVGLGGMINEMLSRVIYRKVLDIDPLQEESELGIFGANYKLAMLITIFIQVFRLDPRLHFLPNIDVLVQVADIGRTPTRILRIRCQVRQEFPAFRLCSATKV